MRRYRVLLAGAVVAAAILAVYVFTLHLPRAERIDEVRAEAERLRAYQVELRDEIVLLEEIAANEDAYVEALDQLEELIPADVAEPALLAELQRAADEAGVELVSVTFGELIVPEAAEAATPADPGVLVEIPLTVAVEGDFFEVAELLRSVEVVMPRAILVDTVSLTQGRAGFPVLTGTWSASIYALVPSDDPRLGASEVPAVPPPAEAPPADSEPTDDQPAEGP